MEAAAAGAGERWEPTFGTSRPSMEDEDPECAGINDYGRAHGHFPSIRCHSTKEKGRILRAYRDWKPGELVLTEKPLAIVVEPSDSSPEAAAYKEVLRLHEDAFGNSAHSPLWYWCALKSLSREDLGPDFGGHWTPALDDGQRRRLLLLHTGPVERASAEVLQLVEHFNLPATCDPLLIERYLQAWFHNAFDHSTDDACGNAIFWFPSFMSHSCFPNAIWRCGEGPVLHLRACRKIAAGGEITICYLSSEEQMGEGPYRRQALFDSKHFWCACERCSADYDLSRGARCPSCPSGSVFARGPCLLDDGRSAEPPGPLKPLRPSRFGERELRDGALWLTAGAPGLARASGRFYYEVELGLRCREPQLGWATEQFQEGAEWSGSGVGDDEESWGADGSRGSWWHAGELPCAPGRWSRPWQAGDVVGCAVDLDAGEMRFSLNGEWAEGGPDFAFELRGRHVYPALSVQGDFRLRLARPELRHEAPAAGFEPLLEECGAGPVDRWSLAPNAFLGSVCRRCGLEVGPQESQRLCRLEGALRWTVGGWEEPLSEQEAEAAERCLDAGLTQHAVRDLARAKLVRHHENLQGANSAGGGQRGRGLERRLLLLQQRLDHHRCAFANPGQNCAYSWVLQEYGNALLEQACSQGEPVAPELRACLRQAKASFVEALAIVVTCFGDGSGEGDYIQGRLREVASLAEAAACSEP